jgi:hypothetical protein
MSTSNSSLAASLERLIGPCSMSVVKAGYIRVSLHGPAATTQPVSDLRSHIHVVHGSSVHAWVTLHRSRAKIAFAFRCSRRRGAWKRGNMVVHTMYIGIVIWYTEISSYIEFHKFFEWSNILLCKMLHQIFHGYTTLYPNYMFLFCLCSFLLLEKT